MKNEAINIAFWSMDFYLVQEFKTMQVFYS